MFRERSQNTRKGTSLAWPAVVSFLEANRNEFMWRSKLAKAGSGSCSGARNTARSCGLVMPCSANMASTIWRGESEYSGSGSNVASKETLLSGPILASRAWAIVLVAAA